MVQRYGQPFRIGKGKKTVYVVKKSGGVPFKATGDNSWAKTLSGF